MTLPTAVPEAAEVLRVTPAAIRRWLAWLTVVRSGAGRIEEAELARLIGPGGSRRHRRAALGGLPGGASARLATARLKKKRRRPGVGSHRPGPWSTTPTRRRRQR
jgi:hypothetical protein